MRVPPDDGDAISGKPSAVARCTDAVIRSAAATPIEVRQNTFQLSASLGVTLFPQDGGDADTLLRHADSALYYAKGQGRNNYQFFAASMAMESWCRNIEAGETR